MHDVVIIGAGPAGTAAAYDLLEAGRSVLLLDKYEFPRKKACAGGVTPKTLNLYRFDISPVILQTCSHIRIVPIKGNDFFIRHANPLCHMTRREDLDAFCLNKVLEKGGRFKKIQKITDIIETPDHVKIITRDEIFDARYLIGADGANSVVRKFVKPTVTVSKAFAIEADIMVDNPLEFQMTFEFRKGLDGYFWIFPKDDHINIGIYSIRSKISGSGKKLETFAREKTGRTHLENIKGYPLGWGGCKTRPATDRILLAGDAAGMAEPLLGEGLYGAVRSGQAASLAIVKALETSQNPGDIYALSLGGLKKDLWRYSLLSKGFYRFPEMSLSLLSLPWIYRLFANGFADGKSLSRILTLNRLFFFKQT